MRAGEINIERGRRGMKPASVLAALLLLSFASVLHAGEPRQETLRAWDEYIQTVNQRVAKSVAGDSPFLWIETSNDIARRVRQNDVVITDLDPENIPQGWIHHWVGAVFVPNVKLDQALSVVESYDRYSEFYKPLFSRSTTLSREGDNATLKVVAVQKVFSVTAAVNTEDQVQEVRQGSKRAYFISKAVQIQEIADYGRSTEHPYPESRRPGYVWRQFGIERLEERDGGVYIELETVVLSRSIPAGFRWLIKPLADDLPRKLMLDVLTDTRTAIQQEAQLASSQRAALTREPVIYKH